MALPIYGETKEFGSGSILSLFSTKVRVLMFRNVRFYSHSARHAIHNVKLSFGRSSPSSYAVRERFIMTLRLVNAPPVFVVFFCSFKPLSLTSRYILPWKTHSRHIAVCRQWLSYFFHDFYPFYSFCFIPSLCVCNVSLSGRCTSLRSCWLVPTSKMVFFMATGGIVLAHPHVCPVTSQSGQNVVAGVALKNLFLLSVNSNVFLASRISKVGYLMCRWRWKKRWMEEENL